MGCGGRRCVSRVGCKAERCDKGEAVRMPRGRWGGSCAGCGKRSIGGIGGR